MAHLMPQLRQKFYDSNGVALALGKVYFYEAGTSTPLATYQDKAELSANANPVILDANGEADIWLKDQAYKVVVRTSADVVVKTVDNVKHNNLATISADMLSSGALAAINASFASYFDPSSGHRHDGIDSKKILGSDIANVAEAYGKILAADGANGSAWIVGARDLAQALTTNATLTALVGSVSCDATSAAFTVTLPTAVGLNGKRFVIKKTDSSFNAVTIDGAGAETIDGVASATLNTQNESIEIVSNNANWVIVQRYIPSTWANYINSGGLALNIAGFGAGATCDLYWKRDGGCLSLHGNITVDTPTAATAQVFYPTGLNAAATSPLVVGTMTRSNASASAWKEANVLKNSVGVRFARKHYSLAINPTTAELGSALASVSDILYFHCSGIAITGWS